MRGMRIEIKKEQVPFIKLGCPVCGIHLGSVDGRNSIVYCMCRDCKSSWKDTRRIRDSGKEMLVNAMKICETPNAIAVHIAVSRVYKGKLKNGKLVEVRE